MAEWFEIKIPYRTVHLFFPRIVIWILVILAAVMLIQYAVKCKKQKKPFFNKSAMKFYGAGTHHFMLWGSLALLVGYIAALEPLGFVNASLIFIFLFNVLFARSVYLYRPAEGGAQPEAPVGKWITRVGRLVIDWKSLFIGAVISVIASYAIWFLFFKIFNITLP